MVSDASSIVTLSTRSQMLARGDADELDEAGADAGAEHRRATPLAGVDDAVAIGAEAAAVDERRGADDVDAGLEDADELVDVGPHRVVDDAVGLQGEQRVDVVGRGDADRVDAAQLADVAPDLVGGPGVAPDQLEVRDARPRRATDRLPTLPVVHCTMRAAICRSPVVFRFG